MRPSSRAPRAACGGWCGFSRSRAEAALRDTGVSAEGGKTIHPPPIFEAKLCSPADAAARAAALPRPLVFTNGVFDILHRGHVTYLAQARALGASLVIA